MVVGFCSIGSRSYSGWCVWALETLAQLQENQILPGLFQDFMDEYIKPEGSSQADKHSVAVMTAGSQSRRSQLVSYG